MSLSSILGIGFSFGGKDENLSKTLDRVSSKFDTVEKAFSKLAKGARGFGSKVSTGLSRMGGAGQRAIGGVVGAIDTMSQRALSPRIDNAFSSMWATFNKGFGETIVGMKMSGKEAGKWRRTIGSAAFALNADMGTTAKNWAEFRKQGVKLDELLGVKGMSRSIRGLIKVTSVFGIEGQQIALMASGLMKGFGFTEKRVRLLMGTVYRMGQAFNVGKEMMQEMPGVLDTINKELADFGTAADKQNVEAYTKSIVKLAIGFKESLGLSAKDAMATSKSLFSTLMGERRNLVDMFRGMGGEFSGIAKALAEKGGVRQALQMILQDPAKFMDALRKMAKKTQEQGGKMGVGFQRLVGVMNKTLGPNVTYAMKGNWDKASGAMAKLDKIASETRKNLGALLRAANKFYKSGRTQGDEFTIMLQSQEQQIQKLTNPMLQDWIRDQRRGFKDFRKGIERVANKGGALGDLTKRLLMVQRVGLSGLFSGKSGLAAIAPVAMQTVQRMGPLLAAFANMGLSLRMLGKLLLPGGLILAGFAMFNKDARKKIMGSLTKIWDYLKKNIPKWIPMVKEALTKLWGMAIEGIKWAMDVASPMLNKLANAIWTTDWAGLAQRVVNFISQFFTGVFNFIFDSMTTDFDTSTAEGRFAQAGANLVGSLAFAMMQTLNTVLANVWSFFTDWSGGLKEGLQTKGRMLGGMFVTALFFGSTRKLMLKGAWMMVKVVAKNLIWPILAMMGEFFAGLLAGQSTYWAVAIGAEKASFAKRVAMSITYHVKVLLISIKNWAKRLIVNAAGWTAQKARDAAGWAWRITKTIAGWIATGAATVAGWIALGAADAAGWVAQKTRDVIGWSWKVEKTYLGWSATGVATVAGWIATGAADAAGWVAQKVRDAAGWAWKLAETPAGWAATTAATAAGWIATSAVDAYGWVAQKVRDAAGWAWKVTTTAAGWVATGAVTAAGWVATGVMDAAGWAAQKARSIAGWAAEIATHVAGWIAVKAAAVASWVAMVATNVAGWVATNAAAMAGAIGMAAAWAVAFWPVTLVIAAIAGIGLAFYALSGKLGETAKKIAEIVTWPFKFLWETIKPLVEAIKALFRGDLGGFFSHLADFVGKVLTAPFRFVWGLAKRVVDLIAHAWGWLRSKLGDTGKAIMDAIAYPFKAVWHLVEWVVSKIKGAWSSVTGFFGSIGSGIKHFFTGGSEEALGAVEKNAVAVKDAVGSAFAAFDKQVAASFQNQRKESEKTSKKVISDSKQMTSAAIAQYYGMTKGVGQSFMTMRQYGGEASTALMGQSAQTVNTTQDYWSTVPPHVAKVFNSELDLSGRANTDMAGHGGKASHFVKGSWGKTGVFVGKVWSTIGKSVAGLWDSITKGSTTSAKAMIAAAMAQAQAAHATDAQMDKLKKSFALVKKLALEQKKVLTAERQKRNVQSVELFKAITGAGIKKFKKGKYAGMTVSEAIEAARKEAEDKGKELDIKDAAADAVRNYNEAIAHLREIQKKVAVVAKKGKGLMAAAGGQAKEWKKGGAAKAKIPGQPTRAQLIQANAITREELKTLDYYTLQVNQAKKMLKKHHIKLSEAKLGLAAVRRGYQRTVTESISSGLLGAAAARIARRKATAAFRKSRGLTAKQFRHLSNKDRKAYQDYLKYQKAMELKRLRSQVSGGASGLGTSTLGTSTITAHHVGTAKIKPKTVGGKGARTVPGGGMKKEERKVNWTVSDETKEVMTSVSGSLENLGAAINNMGKPVVTINFTGDIAPFLKRLKRATATSYGNMAGRQ